MKIKLFDKNDLNYCNFINCISTKLYKKRIYAINKETNINTAPHLHQITHFIENVYLNYGAEPLWNCMLPMDHTNSSDNSNNSTYKPIKIMLAVPFYITGIFRCGFIVTPGEIQKDSAIYKELQNINRFVCCVDLTSWGDPAKRYRDTEKVYKMLKKVLTAPDGELSRLFLPYNIFEYEFQSINKFYF